MERYSGCVGVLVLGLGGGCGDDPAPPAQPTVYEATVRFQVPSTGLPAPLEVPFPSDLYLRADADGTVAELSDWSRFGVSASPETFTEGYGGLDGFGRTTGAVFLVDGADLAPDALPSDGAESLTPQARVALVDLRPAPGAPVRVPAVAGYSARYHLLTVQPDGVVLEAAHPYAVVVTVGVRTTRGPLGPSPAFRAVRDNAPGSRGAPAGRLYGDAVDAVVRSAGVARERIAGVAVFTTQGTHRQLRGVRDDLVAGRFGPAPQFTADPAQCAPFNPARFGADAHDGWTATLDAWLGMPLRDASGRDVPGEPHGSEAPTLGVPHDALGAVVTGTFTSPEFRRRWNGNTDREEGTFQWDDQGHARPVVAAQRLPITLALPRTPAPPSGYPVVIYGHGLGGQRAALLGVANELARGGIATLAVDTATFGQRALGQQHDRTSLYATRGSYLGPDGLPDNPGYDSTTFFGGLNNILSLRDNIRQTALDYVQLRRLVANPALDLSAVAAQYGGAAPRLDGARVGYVGNSLGGIVGTVFSAVDPDVNPVVLNVPGGALVAVLAADSPVIGATVTGAARTLYHYPAELPVDRWHPLASLVQGILDGGDPAAYASEVTRPPTGRGHDVWLTMVDRDSVVPNRATELLARAMRLPQRMPSLRALPGLAPATGVLRGNDDGRTRALVLQGPATHGSNLQSRFGNADWEPPFPRDASPAERFRRLPAAVRVRQPVVATQRALVRFLQTGWDGAAELDAEAMDSLEDYDDDGWTDAEERAMSTRPFDPESHPAGPAPHPRSLGF
ncbi:MAG: hypothetical protein HY909_26935 [Deltaproteobacteria bacterium]|nr:hypothetical protein [Deltaproteobacteria bacterium]